jgi:2-oxoglutarate dehydrogenase E2 component (dihydrolipoamide succinyltransferase)
MAQFELIMPKMGESIMEATILKWLKNEGDLIEPEESVLEIATDKVDSEVPSPMGGILRKKLYAENEVVAVGKPIALIDTTAEESDSASGQAQTSTSNAEIHTVAILTEPLHQTTAAADRFYSPLVLNIAREEGIAMSELERVAGTGKDGRVTKKDILDYVAQRQQGKLATPVVATTTEQIMVAPPAAPRTEAPAAKVSYGDNVEIIEMDRMRRLIADHMVMSKHTSAHVTSFIEVDVTEMVKWRDRVKHAFEKREGEKITFTPIFIEAVVKALKEYPLLNASVDGTNIIMRKNINIGMAAALPSGNLIVPVIKDADHKNLIGLTKTVNDLAQRARHNKLKPEDIQGGTFTLSNVGTFGSVMGTPVINQPQVAILATGTIRKKPAVIETQYGDVIAIRQMMFLSLSYDHRIIDGALGSQFLKRVADLLEDFDSQRQI